MCSVFFLMDSKLMESILFGDDLNTEKLRLRRAFDLRFIESILEISCETFFQPRTPAHLI